MGRDRAVRPGGGGVAARIIHEAIDAGVSFLDNAWESPRAAPAVGAAPERRLTMYSRTSPSGRAGVALGPAGPMTVFPLRRSAVRPSYRVPAVPVSAGD